MKEIKLTWMALKMEISNRDLKMQYTDMETSYYVYAIDGIMLYSCQIEKDEDTPSSERTDFETNYQSSCNDSIQKQNNQPFASKTIGDKKLFRRVHGVKKTLSGDTTFDLVIPYDACKINAIEILWAPECLQADLKVYDTPTGAISTVPNYMLNQFGFDAGIAKDFYVESSNYDADLIKDMKVEVVLKNPANSTKEVCVNFILHELKS